MPRNGSVGPEFRHGSQSSQRKASLTEPLPARHTTTQGKDILSDALYVPQAITLGNQVETPIDNVKQVLEMENAKDPSPLFTEMLYLSTELEDDQDQPSLFWGQTSRWIKYEQTVEGDGTRFSKPHITLLNVHSMLQLKNCIRKGVVLLDTETNSYVQLVDIMINSWVDHGFLEEEHTNLIKDIMYAPKLHLVQGKMRKLNDMSVDEKFKVRRGSHFSNLDELCSPDRQDSTGHDSTKFEDADERLLKKLSPDTESAVILAANVLALDRPLCAFIRLQQPQLLYPELPDHPIPVKFMFVLLNSSDNYANEAICLGRAMGALFADEIFKKVAYYSMQKYTIADGIEEFLTQIIAIPPGNCNVETRWQPREESELEARKVGMFYAFYEDPFDEDVEPVHTSQEAKIVRTGQCFGGLIEDIKRKAPWFISDFTDFFFGRLSQSLAVAIFMFFANITTIITFGAVMERMLHHQMAAIENIICGALSGIIFGLFSGQPLNILSATGPTLVFEKILFDFCSTHHWEFLPFRFWVGMWMALFLVILIATDASALVGLITRFTEESFAFLISVVFIIQAFQKLYEIGYEAPITIHPEEVLHSTCYCVIEMSDGFNGTIVKNLSVGVTRCRELGGTPEGLQCFFKPDVYMFSILLTFGSFSIAYSLHKFRRTTFFSSKIRNSISDFGVFIAIVSMTLLTHIVGLEIPSLKAPTKLRPTLDRNWIVDPTHIEGIYVAVIALFPAAFYTILVVMDQQITAVIVNRKDNKLKKGHGYHLDLLVITILIIVCSALGLPFYVAATVLSVMHVDSLKITAECSAPGEKPSFLGVKEQRLTNVLAHVAIGCSVFLTPLVQLVPLPVLTGIFLYMGIVSLIGQQFVQRIMLIFMPIKHQPDYVWLRNVRMKRVHLFTIIQILSILSLFAVKYTKSISMVFPLMLVVTVMIRLYLLEKLFTKKELVALDDEVPSFAEVMTPPSTHKHELVAGSVEDELEHLKQITVN